tara:strand:+ start:6526 stop:7278 length:753 start_codon:yes stop_codon:yes gene_type:complete
MAELAISTSNVLIDVVPTLTDAGTGEVAANISDPDHSLNYTCGTAIGDFQASYGAQSNISYVAISGHTAATPATATIELYDNVTLIDTVTITRNNNIMFTFPEMSFTDLIVKFITVPNNYQMTVSFIAAGQYLAIQTGQQAGYARNWLNRHVTQRSNSTLEGAPISSIQTAKPLPGTLSLPNQLASFTEGPWQVFLDFAFKEPFFIKEFQDKPESSYICYDPVSSVKSHPLTPTLDVITLKLTCFNGILS